MLRHLLIAMVIIAPVSVGMRLGHLQGVLHAVQEPKLDAPKIVREQPKPKPLRIRTVIGLTAFADGRAGVQVLEIDGHHYIFTVGMGNNPNLNAMHAESCPCKKQKAWVD